MRHLCHSINKLILYSFSQIITESFVLLLYSMLICLLALELSMIHQIWTMLDNLHLDICIFWISKDFLNFSSFILGHLRRFHVWVSCFHLCWFKASWKIFGEVEVKPLVPKRGSHSKIYLLRDFLNHLTVHKMFQAIQSSSVYTNAGIQSNLRKLAG